MKDALVRLISFSLHHSHPTRYIVSDFQCLHSSQQYSALVGLRWQNLRLAAVTFYCKRHAFLHHANSTTICGQKTIQPHVLNNLLPFRPTTSGRSKIARLDVESMTTKGKSNLTEMKLPFCPFLVLWERLTSKALRWDTFHIFSIFQADTSAVEIDAAKEGKRNDF